MNEKLDIHTCDHTLPWYSWRRWCVCGLCGCSGLFGHTLFCTSHGPYYLIRGWIRRVLCKEHTFNREAHKFGWANICTRCDYIVQLTEWRWKTECFVGHEKQEIKP